MFRPNTKVGQFFVQECSLTNDAKTTGTTDVVSGRGTKEMKITISTEGISEIENQAFVGCITGIGAFIVIICKYFSSWA